MQEEINQLRSDIESLKSQLESQNNIVIPTNNNSVTEFNSIFGTVRTITVAAELTKRTAGKPDNISDQILIDTTTATKKLYIYDTIGKVWRSCTIA